MVRFIIDPIALPVWNVGLYEFQLIISNRIVPKNEFGKRIKMFDSSYVRPHIVTNTLLFIVVTNLYATTVTAWMIRIRRSINNFSYDQTLIRS